MLAGIGFGLSFLVDAGRLFGEILAPLGVIAVWVVTAPIRASMRRSDGQEARARAASDFRMRKAAAQEREKCVRIERGGPAERDEPEPKRREPVPGVFTRPGDLNLER